LPVGVVCRTELIKRCVVAFTDRHPLEIIVYNNLKIPELCSILSTCTDIVKHNADELCVRVCVCFAEIDLSVNKNIGKFYVVFSVKSRIFLGVCYLSLNLLFYAHQSYKSMLNSLSYEIIYECTRWGLTRNLYNANQLIELRDQHSLTHCCA